LQTFHDEQIVGGIDIVIEIILYAVFIHILQLIADRGAEVLFGHRNIAELAEKVLR